MLTDTEIERYGRQLILKDWGAEKQEKLKALCVAAPNSLPSLLYYLTAAGVGQIETYSETNGHLFQAADLNPDIKISYQTDLKAKNVDVLVRLVEKLPENTKNLITDNSEISIAVSNDSNEFFIAATKTKRLMAGCLAALIITQLNTACK